MIPTSSFLLDGDTALWVPPPHLPMNDWAANRPCDRCFGHGRIVHSSGAAPYCQSCDGTGRHTFDINVGEWIPPRSDGSDTTSNTLRVHVIDERPIYHADDDGYPEADHYSLGESECWLWEWDQSSSDFICHEDITLPSDAAPGMWLVRLAVHQ